MKRDEIRTVVGLKGCKISCLDVDRPWRAFLRPWEWDRRRARLIKDQLPPFNSLLSGLRGSRGSFMDLIVVHSKSIYDVLEHPPLVSACLEQSNLNSLSHLSSTHKHVILELVFSIKRANFFKYRIKYYKYLKKNSCKLMVDEGAGRRE